MTQNKFGIIAMIVVGGGWLIGALAGNHFESKIVAAGVAFLVPALPFLLAGGPVGRAWWSINREESAKADFRSEAKQSLRLVAIGSTGVAVVFGLMAYFGDSIYEAAFAGTMFSMAVFSAIRLRDVSARTLS